MMSERRRRGVRAVAGLATVSLFLGTGCGGDRQASGEPHAKRHTVPSAKDQVQSRKSGRGGIVIQGGRAEKP